MVTNDEIVDKVGEWKEKLGLAQKQPIPQGAERSLIKGMLAGLIGGIAGTGAKTLAERLFPPRTHGEPEPPALLTEKVAGQTLSAPQKLVAAESLHWSFGALAGAAYGGVAEFYPAATQKEGASFGLVLAAVTHDNALPALGLAAGPDQRTKREQTSEMATHVVYGVVTEVVRSLVRRLL